MPVMKPCLDCGALTPKRRCPAHEREFQRRRKAAGRTGARGTTGEWRRIRERVLRRDGRRCTRCGEWRMTMHVHHLNHDPRDNRLENLVSLCQNCHRELHRSA